VKNNIQERRGLVSAIADGPASSAEILLAHLFADVTAFVGEGETRDDMTIVWCGIVASASVKYAEPLREIAVDIFALFVDSPPAF
jgi:hypothetical protein